MQSLKDSVSVTGAAGAAVTATLAAPANAGDYIFIGRLIVQRFATALLTAGAAPLVVTTTNLQGARALSFPADAALQGVVATELLELARPLRATTPGIAVTIVCPATPNVIWRVTADYFSGPEWAGKLS